jgi:hypothetical protein
MNRRIAAAMWITSRILERFNPPLAWLVLISHSECKTITDELSRDVAIWTLVQDLSSLLCTV